LALRARGVSTNRLSSAPIDGIGMLATIQRAESSRRRSIPWRLLSHRTLLAGPRWQSVAGIGSESTHVVSTTALPLILRKLAVLAKLRADQGGSSLRQLKPKLTEFLARFDDCFARRDTREHLPVYVEGQLSDLQRKSIEPIALRAKVKVRTKKRQAGNLPP
jgi:hypothetical protein